MGESAGIITGTPRAVARLVEGTAHRSARLPNHPARLGHAAATAKRPTPPTPHLSSRAKRGSPDSGPFRGPSAPQPTAFFTSATIFASSAAVSSFSANEVGHIAPSSSFASSLKPNVAYRALNLLAFWK